MLTAEQINAIHRLHWSEHWSVRKIARHLHLGRRTISQYLVTPARSAAHRQRASKLDPFKATIAELLEQDAKASAMVIAQRLRSLGFNGGLSILKDYLHAVRAHTPVQRAYVRMEPGPGERFEIDWGHFGALLYQGHARKLYAFCLVECHSRKLFVEFTHSQSFETFVRCHLHAFQFLGGIARELWYDNLATAVAEHDGNLVRFHPRFLAFAREYSFLPRACHVRAAWEKGKIERAVGYLRQNFWPLRTFADLTDVNSQVRRWLEQVANQRHHRETGETPAARFQPETLRALPVITPDYRDSTEALVHKDLRLAFDGNRYCVPPRYVGRRLTIKADASSVTFYDQYQEIVSYARCWQRGQTLGAERFQKELLAQLTAAQRSAEQQRLVRWLGPASESYLRRLADTDRSLTRQVRELLLLVREYGPDAVAAAVGQAHAAGAFGADYIANLLRQQRMRRDVQPPLRSRTHNSMNWPPIRCRWPTTTLSSFALKRTPMTLLQQKLNQLNLATMSLHLDQMLTDATARNLSLAQTLEALLDRELEARHQRSIERRFKLSRLQSKPSIDSFHFNHHKSRLQLKTRILRLLDLDFLRDGTSVCLIGNPGVGKTYLAKIIGWRACQANQRVLFTTAMDMLNHLLASQVDHSLIRKLKIYTEPALLVVDELGYLSLDQQTSNLFYQVISTRHSHKRSTLITTNTAFSDWGNILYNTTIATAIADRLVENSEIFLLGGDSLRKGNKSQPPTE